MNANQYACYDFDFLVHALSLLYRLSCVFFKPYFAKSYEGAGEKVDSFFCVVPQSCDYVENLKGGSPNGGKY